MTATVDRWVTGLTIVGVLFWVITNWEDTNNLIAGMGQSAVAYVSGISNA
jgi:hypothetical protein